MKDIKRMVVSEEARAPNNKQPKLQDDIDFMLWKNELNKELVPFWKSLRGYFRTYSCCSKRR